MVIAECSITLRICTPLQDTSTLAKKCRHMNHIIKQEPENGLTNNMNTENGLFPGRSSHSHPEEMQDDFFKKQALTWLSSKHGHQKGTFNTLPPSCPEIVTLSMSYSSQIPIKGPTSHSSSLPLTGHCYPHVTCFFLLPLLYNQPLSQLGLLTSSRLRQYFNLKHLYPPSIIADDGNTFFTSIRM